MKNKLSNCSLKQQLINKMYTFNLTGREWVNLLFTKRIKRHGYPELV